MIKKIHLINLLILLVLSVVTSFVLFNKSIAEAASKPTVIEFTSPMCSACNQLKQVLPAIESKYGGQVNIRKINVAETDSETSSLVSKYSVNFVPKLVFIDGNGKVIRTTQGFLSESQLDTYFKELIK